MLNFIRNNLFILGFVFLVINSCEHLQVTPQNYRGGNCNPDTVYFVNDVQPILVSQCALSGCHDSKSKKEGVILDDYNNIIKTGKIKIGKGLKSEIIKIMRTNSSRKMPPSGKLSDFDISKISKWIVQGAKNNQCVAGCDSMSFSFSTQINPIINTNCLNCHANSGNPILLNSYLEIKKNVDNGMLWGAINHLSGYKPMPSLNLKLTDCEINKIKKWISIGAPNN